MTPRFAPRAIAGLVAALLPLSCHHPSHRVAPACAATRTPLLRGIRSIHADRAITCAVLTNGRVACWGIDDNGRLGAGFELERQDRPALVPGLTGVNTVTIGNDATFALMRDGSIRVWGTNRGGEFGDGSREYHIAWSPRSIVEWGKVRMIEGGIPTCAVRDDARVVCAGYPRFRRAGEEPRHARTANIVSGLEGIRTVAAGSGFTCALNHRGAVWCWGMADVGQLGSGVGEDRSDPLRVHGIGPVAEIAAGVDTICARLVSGRIECWGRSLGGYGLGDSDKWLRPAAIQGTDDAVQLAVGGRVACVVTRAGQVRCWGEASYDGQLGDGTAETRARVAKPVACIDSAVQVTVGDNHSCALLRDGTARCWGSGPYGALGDGTQETRYIPVAVLDAEDPKPPADRCAPGTTYRRGRGDDPLEVSAEWCEGPDGRREGRYVSRWASGQKLQEGLYMEGVRHGAWTRHYEHGAVVSEDSYERGEPHGVWIAYGPRGQAAFATCFDRGRRLWQVSDAREIRNKSCP